jgi:hypothetical protein
VTGALQRLERLLFTDFPFFDAAQHGVQFVELQLLDVHIAQEIARKGAQLLGGLDQPLQDRIRLTELKLR